MDISIFANKKEPRKFTNPILREAEKKVEVENILRTRDELAFRIEMARMSGLARELDKYRDKSESIPSFLHHLIRDLRAFSKVSPREASILKDRLIEAMHTLDQGSFQTTMSADQQAHLSSLAVR